MNRITVRTAAPTDDFVRLGACIYQTDPYIYPCAFGDDPDAAARAIAALMTVEGGLFHYKNVLAAFCGDEVCGTLVFSAAPAVWQHERCAALVAPYIPDPAGFALASERYFAAEAAAAVSGQVEIVACCTAPQFRRRGVARAMLERLFALHPGAVFSLDVLADNPGAVALYRSCGFEAVSQEKGFAADPAARPDCLHMLRR